MSEKSLIRALLLPELTLVAFRRVPDSRVIEVVLRFGGGVAIEHRADQLAFATGGRNFGAKPLDPVRR